MSRRWFALSAAAEARAFAYRVHGELEAVENGWLVWF